MIGFSAAHGDDPGPTQRPLRAGAISGFIATIPAIAILVLSGALLVEARILRLSEAATVGAGCVAMAFAGAVYGRLFGRDANDPRGGWLFGMVFGFVLWAGGVVLVLPLVSNGKTPAGLPAIGVFVSLVAWGAVLGTIHPLIHRPLHRSIESASKLSKVGPNAAAPGRQRGLKPPREGPPGQPRP